MLERYGPYLCYFDADTTEVEVFTETGQQVGTAPGPEQIGTLLEAFEERQARRRRVTRPPFGDSNQP
ncbi:hypothetical protein [Streptomyces sp. OspMP-M43]|uniref:hypothetical protein n=1 Tax=Streptomyces sp. OspMP-M43 TaxID=1839781 RepID=UPI00081B4B96|nr:hypothetical protein [Streptomyces sp. OspMP-M43]SCE48769.1 hypothetical protein GA0115261_106053 [Streptomyces sp. OspMP-M43]